MLTVSTHLAIPSLVGRGLTESAARSALSKAKIFGRYPVSLGGTRVIPISYSCGKFTIGEIR